MIATTLTGYLYLFLSATTVGVGFTLGARIIGKLVK